MTSNQSDPTKNPSARKSLRQYSEALYVKHKNGICGLCSAKENLKAIITGNTLWSNISKRRGHKKTNQKVKEDLYNWILRHPRVVQSPIVNDCIYESIYCNSKKQLMPKLSLQVSVRELHNSTVSPPEEGGLKEASDVNNYIIIINSTLQYIIPHQLKKVNS